MGKLEKLYEYILMRRSDVNVPFEPFMRVIETAWF